MSHSQEIAFRYSKALFQRAETDAHREDLLQEIRRVLVLFEQSSSLRTLFFSFSLNLEEKQLLLEKGFKGKIDPLLYLFLDLLLRKGRFSFLRSIGEKYEERVKEQQGILEGQLQSAVPVSQEEKLRLVGRLEKALKKKIVLQEKIDPALKGGAVLMVGGYMIDNAIPHRLDRLKQQLLVVGKRNVN